MNVDPERIRLSELLEHWNATVRRRARELLKTLEEKEGRKGADMGFDWESPKLKMQYREPDVKEYSRMLERRAKEKQPDQAPMPQTSSPNKQQQKERFNPRTAAAARQVMQLKGVPPSIRAKAANYLEQYELKTRADQGRENLSK